MLSRQITSHKLPYTDGVDGVFFSARSIKKISGQPIQGRGWDLTYAEVISKLGGMAYGKGVKVNGSLWSRIESRVLVLGGSPRGKRRGGETRMLHLGASRWRRENVAFEFPRSKDL